MRDDIATMLLDRLGDEHIGLRTRERDWTWDEVVHESAARGALASALRTDGPFHIGVLLDNVPDFIFWLGGAALAGATIVGINPTRGPAEMAADIRHADCQLIVTDSARIPLLRGLDIDLAADRILAVDSPEYTRQLAGAPHRAGRRAATSARNRFSCCCSRPAPPGRPRRSGAARAGWPGSPTPRSRSTATSATTSTTAACRCSTATRSWRCGPRPWRSARRSA